MERQHRIAFGPFCLDVTHGRLWRGEHVLALRPRSLAVLRYLAEHPGRLVTKAELATAGVGGDARQHQRAPCEYHGNSRGVGRRSDRTALSGDGRTAGVSLSRLGRHGEAPTAGSWTDRGPPPRRRAPRAMAPGRCRRQPPARLCEWRRGHWQDDGGRPRAGPSRCRERGAERAGAVRRAVWRGGTVPRAVRGCGAALPRPSGAGGLGRAPALCTDVARAIPRARGREGPGTAATPGARGDARADAA